MQSLPTTLLTASLDCCGISEIFTMAFSAIGDVLFLILSGLVISFLHFLMIASTVSLFQLFGGQCGKVSDTLDLDIEPVFWSAISVDVICLVLYGLLAGPYYFVMLLITLGAFKAAFCVSVKVAEAFGFNNRAAILWVMIVTALGLHPNIAM